MTDDGVEELPQPEQRAKLRRMRIDIAVGAVVLLVLLLIFKQRGKDDADGTAGPTPTPTAGSTSSEIPQSFDDEPLGVYPVPDRPAGNRARCPDGWVCPVAHLATAGTKAALEAAFPGAEVAQARTVRAVVTGYGQTVWTIDVRALIGETELRLRVQPLSPADEAKHSTILFGGHSITHWESMLSQVLVLIDVIAPADEPVSLDAVEQLAHDTRLIRSW